MKTVIRLFLIVALVSFASTASALTISGGIVVGGIDTLVAWAQLDNSGDATELAFVNDYIDGIAGEIEWVSADLVKDTSMEGAWTVTTENNSAVAYDFGADGSSFYIIKTGNVGYSSDPIPGTSPVAYYKYDTFLYQNLESLQYAVISLSELGTYGDKPVNIGKISHIDYVSDIPVPEPSTLLLLGAGIVGLAAYRRKKN